MAKFVPDIKSNRWVVIAPARVTRPHDNIPFADQNVGAIHESPLQKCPFCPGNESLNKTVFAVGDVRVIANKYPITDFHEVIIHSPDHEKDIDELPTEQVELILNVYRQRYNYYKDKGTVMIFNNHDIHAGASLSHPHSQLVVVPKQINLDSMKKEPIQNVVVESKQFVAYCPDFSQWPYEIWVAPLCHAELAVCHPDECQDLSTCLSDHSHSGEIPGQARNDTTFGSITDDQIKDLAPLLQKILKVVVNRFRLGGRNDTTEDIPYNFYIYHGADWYLRIIPRLIHRAGFELGTGLSVNIVDPATAAEEYKKGIV